jgi:hypothetical protein
MAPPNNIDIVITAIAFYLSHLFKFRLCVQRESIELILRIFDFATQDTFIKLNFVFSNEKE